MWQKPILFLLFHVTMSYVHVCSYSCFDSIVTLALRGFRIKSQILRYHVRVFENSLRETLWRRVEPSVLPLTFENSKHESFEFSNVNVKIQSHFLLENAILNPDPSAIYTEDFRVRSFQISWNVPQHFHLPVSSVSEHSAFSAWLT